MSFSPIEIHLDSIRANAAMVYAVGVGWAQDLREARPGLERTDAYGDDALGRELRQVHDDVVPATLAYLVEVGQATEDLGIALGEVADEYEQLEHGNLLAIGEIWQTLADLGLA